MGCHPSETCQSDPEKWASRSKPLVARLSVCDTCGNGGRRRTFSANVNTTVGFLLLGSTFNSPGLASKGWYYTGYDLRMIYELGFHMDCKVTIKESTKPREVYFIEFAEMICPLLKKTKVYVTASLGSAGGMAKAIDGLHGQELFDRDALVLHTLSTVRESLGKLVAGNLATSQLIPLRKTSLPFLGVFFASRVVFKDQLFEVD
ncbi:hypothetical protein GGI35DRAFT_483854 [Trichoderma velutinum]